LEVIEAAAAQRGIKAVTITVRDAAQITPALDAFAAEPNGGIIPVPPIGVLPLAEEIIYQAAYAIACRRSTATVSTQ
jgi:hypothetical protein